MQRRHLRRFYKNARPTSTEPRKRPPLNRLCERSDMEQGRGNPSAIPHEMLGTRTETMRTAQTGILWRVAATRMPTKWGMFSAIGFEREVSNGSQRAETALAI